MSSYWYSMKSGNQIPERGDSGDGSIDTTYSDRCKDRQKVSYNTRDDRCFGFLRKHDAMCILPRFSKKAY